jgi:hypothetical protein
MEHQFDELAKALAEGMSRREVLSRVGGVLAGGVLALLGMGAASAERSCPEGTHLSRCQNGEQLCCPPRSTCVELFGSTRCLERIRERPT